MAKTRVGVLFGSRSVEHDVSIITGRQVVAALDRDKYDVVPIYITEQGQWLSGPALETAPLTDFKAKAPGLPGVERVTLSPDPTEHGLVSSGGRGVFGLGGQRKVTPVDVMFPTVHGTYGEDGTLQGLFELAGLPYVGAGVVGSAVGMDKILMKAAFQAAGLPAVPQTWFPKVEWEQNPAAILDGIEQHPGYPVFVKPANLGSSVGINRANDRNELEYAIEVAVRYDRRILVEQGLDGIVEVNCSVTGNDDPQASWCEQPARWQDFLSFDDKYLAGGKGSGMSGQKRLIPAPLGDALTAEVQRLAIAAFRAVDCAGIARIDFLVRPDEGKVWVNEINTMPGSLAFYLWEPAGVPFPALCDRLITLAFERYEDRKSRMTSFSTRLLQQGPGSKSAGPR